MKHIHTRDFNNSGNTISCTVDLKDDEEIISSQVINFRNKSEMDSQLKNILTIAKEVADLFPTLKDGEWLEPIAIITEPIIISEEELAKQNQFQKQIDLQQAVDFAKTIILARELASTNTDIAEKLEAYNISK
jgi:superfamily I DNA/RNA helicase